MKFKLQLVCELAENDAISTEDIFAFEKDFDSFESIGMSLSESKDILKSLQQNIIEKQLTAFVKSKITQKLRKKGSYMVKLKTLFGDISFKSPRYYSPEGAEQKTYSPLNELLPQHTTPELLFIETKWACLIPFEKTANLLKDLLPVSETLNGSTIQNNLYDLVMTQEKEIGEEQFMFDCRSINERRALLKPERTMVVGIDGGYIRDWNEKKVIFEVIVGKSVPDEREAKCFGFVSSYDTKSKRRFYEHLKSQGMQPHQKMDFLSDGADNLRNLQTYLNAESTHILDWFHITIRLTVLNQYVLGMLKVDKKIGTNLQELLASIKWNLWHGKVGEALQKAEEIEDYLEEHKEDKGTKDRYQKLKAFGTYADEFHTYISNNRSFIVNYSDRYLHGETITTSFIESTVNYVIAKRFSKKQSMQWTKKGTHLLLQARTKVLNNDWEGEFRKKYPKFRAIKSLNEPGEIKLAA